MSGAFFVFCAVVGVFIVIAVGVACLASLAIVGTLMSLNEDNVTVTFVVDRATWWVGFQWNTYYQDMSPVTQLDIGILCLIITIAWKRKKDCIKGHTVNKIGTLRILRDGE